MKTVKIFWLLPALALSLCIVTGCGSGKAVTDTKPEITESSAPTDTVSETEPIFPEYNIFGLTDREYELVKSLSGAMDASGVDTYALADDGGLIYNPVSREKAGELDKYAGAECFTGSVSARHNGVDVTLNYSIPKTVTAYDAVPIRYELSSSAAVTQVVYVDVTAFEDAYAEDRPYYDLSLPGLVDVRWEYEGYVGGVSNAGNRPILAGDLSKDVPGVRYPQYDATELICSGTVKTANILWFKFKYTNTGNTVLEGDGNGTFCFEPLLYKKNGDSWEQIGKLENLYARLIKTLYPGESGELYFTFNKCSNLAAGEYRIIINGLVRNETSNPEKYGKNIWGGEIYTTSHFTFTVAEQAFQTAPEAVVRSYVKDTATRNRWLHSYEEFMSSYDSWLKGVNGTVADTMYLQCAPWTNQVVVKLIVGNGDTMKAVSIPVSVKSDSVKVRLNADCGSYVTLKDGTRFPAIQAQSMADMRGNVQLGPDAAANVIGNLAAMRQCGINVISTTAAFEFDSSYGKGVNNNVDACWFSLDAARVLGLKVEGWISYPYGSANIKQANSLFGLSLTDSGYGTPDLANASALAALWQFTRWGDNYWIGGDNTVVLGVEDTRGWMRVDFNARITMSETSKQNFRLFLTDIYKNIDALNADWGTIYAGFDEIDPEAGTSDDHGWARYKRRTITFGEWSKPLAILDCFRTLERIYDYKTVLENLSHTLPTALINMRTEGANWIAPVNPGTRNSHYRHVYYSQRRCGIIAELMGQSGVLYAASDYTTLPYTPSEVGELTALSVENGVVPILLPQFNRMRDIAVNSKYGNDFTYEYNLSGATKGAYINTVCSVFEWFRAAYENGGVPGILWQDYLCDGCATETQRKEIAFFTEKLTEALNTPEGREWVANFNRDESVLSSSKGTFSYSIQDVESLVEAYLNSQK